jgi:hypothetical protein
VNKKLVIGLGALGLLVTVGAVAARIWRGPTGETQAIAVPEFPSLDATRWKNGAPQSLAAIRGEVVFLEGWSPT